MRIALICVSLRGGGTERIVCRLANHLSTSHEVAVITVAPRKPFYPLSRAVQVIQASSATAALAKPLRVLQQAKHLYSSVRNFRPNLCMIFGEDIAWPATLIAKIAGTSRVWSFFRGRPERSIKGLNGLMNRVFCRLGNHIFVQTAAGKEALSDSYPSRKLTVWPNPIELPDSITPLHERDRLIVNVGSIGRLKNQQALMNIFGGLLGEAETWTLLFVGDGPDRPALESCAGKSDAAPRITFAGEQKHVSPYLNRAAIFALTSLSEGFPNALAEAMAAGCACISYDCPTGPSELIEHGVSGFLVEPGDEAEYTRLLQRLIDKPELRTRFSRNARKSVARFETGTVMKRLESMIEEAIGGGETSKSRLNRQGAGGKRQGKG